MSHTRCLQTTEEILCCKITDNGKFLAIGLLDNTAKVYFLDTLKVCTVKHLALHQNVNESNVSVLSEPLRPLAACALSGHLLRQLAGGDRLGGQERESLGSRLWRLSQVAVCTRWQVGVHGNIAIPVFIRLLSSVTCVKFVPNTHLFFSAGKDGKIKQWDADKFERIQVLTVEMVVFQTITWRRAGFRATTAKYGPWTWAATESCWCPPRTTGPSGCGSGVKRLWLCRRSRKWSAGLAALRHGILCESDLL